VTFLLSKLFWIFAAPGNFLVLLLTVGTLRLAVTRRRHGFGLIAAATIGLLAMTALPVGEWLLIPLENRFDVPTSLPQRIDGIVVLGGAVDEAVSQARGQVRLNRAADRLTSAARLAQRYPEARVVVSGGNRSVFAEEPAEAAIMREFLLERGIDAERIAVEPRSRNTYENARFTYAEVQPKPGEAWLLVTSAAHMPRAVGCFRAAGWAVFPYPVDYRTAGLLSVFSELSLSEQLGLVNGAAREWVALAVYRILGRTSALFPAPG
jgi:uncharacterized SAM-binding protein YcdF (DUF218 family)